MRFRTVSLLSIAILLVGSFAAASTITLNSTGGSLDQTNNCIAILGSGACPNGDSTVAITPNGVWKAPPAGVSWVSYDQTTPNGPADGTVINFYQSFILPVATSYSGSVTVYADDTTGVWLNGNQLFVANLGPAQTYCGGPIGCVDPNGQVVDLSAFLHAGSNTLMFDVNQMHGDGFGLMYYGSAAATPEPGSLLLFGSGLASIAGFVRRMKK